MVPDNSPFILLDDAREGGDAAPARLYRNPVQIVEVRKPDDLDTALDSLAKAQQRGLHAAGYMSYEAGMALEDRLLDRLPGHRPCPLAWFGLFEDYTLLQPDEVIDQLPDPKGAWLGTLRPGVTRREYDRAFAKVQDYIIAGDIYQANLTFRAHARRAGHPLALYAAIRDRAKAGYGGVVFDGKDWILSFSPELFFAMKDGRITAKPMKGTAARVKDAAADLLVQAEMLNDPKQRAENLMIVDLLRNDLSRVAEPGSVKVPELFHVETYPTIHTMTSTVTAQLKDGLDAVDALRQIYPCGSITGAPKIRAMEIIDELEKDQRGIYCGSIGRMDANGDAAFNVAIRTFYLEMDQDTLSIGLGSGIVADSVGGDEWRECLAKGRFAAVDVGVDTDVSDAVDLIETMAFDPERGILRLEAHLERMKASAAALEFEFDRHAARNMIQAITFHQDQPAKVRLMLSRSGAIAIELQPMPEPLSEPVSVRLVPMSAHPQDYRLHHKTSDRSVYAVPGLNGRDHPIFHDSQGYLTEGAIWSIFVERDGKLLTPPLGRGVLPGILRGQLLESGDAIEADLQAGDLDSGLYIGNSLRGLVKAELA
ncbi:aminodeoxychorismate synthase component I [Parasphingorhabdus cellanae]|uniref:Probable branched-chain-amino-acid aminotransferase n=1 Tax=Parasphingorhabdus cellanae TaxID=2806553 RepID=A0ABX7T6L3_9SPHN|nr:aminodeoxychorismate synthase component I [Parasphingorhabdus cellanae]QTD57166.1 aminodeoxychorismate synthase component I [Parasphingorhabdus cellanae]